MPCDLIMEIIQLAMFEISWSQSSSQTTTHVLITHSGSRVKCCHDLLFVSTSSLDGKSKEKAQPSSNLLNLVCVPVSLTFAPLISNTSQLFSSPSTASSVFTP
ncbi:hypothetical protein AMECASPLE_000265 [Ameca splendens]|uniref:Uncharacterized protein n=1 Tax=Ameca splendens TaxID=208324 RepID=A0ABV0Z8R7_9TELE